MITNVMLIASELLRVMSYSHRDTLIPIAILTIFTTIVSRFVLKIKERQELIITMVILVCSSSGLISKYYEKVGPFSNPLDAFYFGYNFCLFDRIVVSRIPSSQYRSIYSVTTMIVKFLVIPFNDKNLMVIHIVYIFAGIYLNFDKEKNDKNLFNSYFNSKNQLTKFKDLVVNDIPEGIVIIRQDLSQCLFANKSFTLLSNFGSNPDIRTHLSQFQIYEEEAKPQSQEKIASAKKTLLSFVETTLVQPDFQSDRKFSCNVTHNRKLADSQGEYNKLTLLEVKAFYIVWDEVPAVAVILHDITQQHTIISLKTANAQKDALLATVSHELRTPLNGMMGMIQILQKKTIDPEFIKYLNICKNSGSLLMGLVNSILDLNQIRAKKLKLNPEKVSLYGILNDMIQLFELQCFQKGIYLKLNISPSMHKNIVTDPNRLSQIFINLIGNALKFTLKGGITISAKESLDGKYVQLSIEDTGIGIREEDKDKLFKMFGKLEHSDSKTNQQGVGLGLTISDNLARLLCGGENRGGITLASCYGKGSIFSFWIKSRLIDDNQQGDDSLSKITAEEGTDIEAKMRRYTMPDNEPSFQRLCHTENLNNLTDNRYVRRGINRLTSSPLFKTVAYSAITGPCFSKADMHVLIVDDNPFNITVAEYLIKSYGYKVKTALYGQTAIDIMLNNNHYAEPIKVILMDCLMPIMDGYETTKILRKLMRERKIPDVPIVALTANNSEADKEASKKAGMCGHLTKPLKETDLFKILDKYAD